jgi:hypothetical protein
VEYSEKLEKIWKDLTVDDVAEDQSLLVHGV